MKPTFTLTMFTPGEVEAITGLSTTMQRDWRRRGFLPTHAGHARFDAFSLAEAWVLKLMADRGIGPSVVRPPEPAALADGVREHLNSVSAWCAAGIVHAALLDIAAYEGEADRTHSWNSAAFAETPAEAMSSIRARWLAERVLREAGFRVQPAGYFVWWPDDTETFHQSVNEAFVAKATQGHPVEGAAIVLHLPTIGAALRSRAGRPLVHVEFEPSGEG